MVGAFSLLGSTVIDSAHACPSMYLDTLNSSPMNVKSVGNVGFSRKSMGKKQSGRVGSLKLSSSFVNPGKELLGAVNKSLRKQRKARRPLIVNELGGQYEDNFEDVKTQLLNYFTYKAVRTVLNQLYEMNPPGYMWFYDYVLANKPGEGKNFIRKLGKERPELAERIMVTRLHLYGQWAKRCDHAEIYQDVSDENLELMRERLMETIIWPSDDSNTEKIG